MKLTDFLFDVGRPVAYYPGLKKITGSTTATLLLCQLLYWRGKEASGDGWLYKTSAEIEEETGLSYDEQVGARKKLVRAGLLEENYKRLEHVIYFRVNLEAVNEAWENCHTTTEKPDSPNGKNPIPHSGDSRFGKPVFPFSLNESETTPEITTETLDGDEKPVTVPTPTLVSSPAKSSPKTGGEPKPEKKPKQEKKAQDPVREANKKALSDAFTRATGLTPSMVGFGRFWKEINSLLDAQVSPDLLTQAVAELKAVNDRNKQTGGRVYTPASPLGYLTTVNNIRTRQYQDGRTGIQPTRVTTPAKPVIATDKSGGLYIG